MPFYLIIAARGTGEDANGQPTFKPTRREALYIGADDRATAYALACNDWQDQSLSVMVESPRSPERLPLGFSPDEALLIEAYGATLADDIPLGDAVEVVSIEEAVLEPEQPFGNLDPGRYFADADGLWRKEGGVGSLTASRVHPRDPDAPVRRECAPDLSVRALPRPPVAWPA